LVLLGPVKLRSRQEEELIMHHSRVSFKSRTEQCSVGKADRLLYYYVGNLADEGFLIKSRTARQDGGTLEAGVVKAYAWLGL
jgi:hypothetical protein